MKTELFDYLVTGLKDYLYQENNYPYPDLLRHAMNTLSLEMKKSIPLPKTINGFLRLLEQPVKNWCPSHFIPKEFDRDFGLIDEESFSEEVNDYLHEELITKGKIPENANSCTQQLASVNKSFISILDKLRDVYNDINPEQAQQEYLLFRQLKMNPR